MGTPSKTFLGANLDDEWLVLAAAAVLAGAAGHRQFRHIIEGMRALDGAAGGAAIVPRHHAQHPGAGAAEDLLERAGAHRVGGEVGSAVGAFYDVIWGFSQAVGTLTHEV
jgi:hypothetical protein